MGWDVLDTYGFVRCLIYHKGMEKKCGSVGGFGIGILDIPQGN